MPPEPLPGIDSLEAFQVGEAFSLFRIVPTDARFDPALLDAFRSSFDLGAEPRKFEKRSALIHMGISTFRTRERAVDMAVRWPKLGQFTAELNLKPENGHVFALTGQTGHVTVWGRPLQLVSEIVDIVPIEG